MRHIENIIRVYRIKRRWRSAFSTYIVILREFRGVKGVSGAFQDVSVFYHFKQIKHMNKNIYGSYLVNHRCFGRFVVNGPGDCEAMPCYAWRQDESERRRRRRRRSGELDEEEEEEKEDSSGRWVDRTHGIVVVEDFLSSRKTTHSIFSEELGSFSPLELTLAIQLIQKHLLGGLVH